MELSLNNLKKALQEELKKENIDFDRVGALSDQLVQLDSNALRFSIDARHIHRLGFELVGKQETALSELIKNAYDADATIVRIDFSEYLKQGGSLVIADDGHGMPEETIRQTWMRLTTSDKEDNPFSPIFKRSRAGKKGIGRFAVERLGEKLILETEVEGKSQGLRMHFNWDELYQHGASLSRIPNQIARYEKQPETHGTRLLIVNLRDRWTEKTLERVWKSVLLLQPPFKIGKQKNKAHKSSDPGFSVIINGSSGKKANEELSIEKSFLSHRTALIRGSVDKNSKAKFFVQSSLLNIDESQKDDEDIYDLIGKLEFEINFFIYTPDAISGISLRDAQRIGKKYGGIRVYLDGFRVMPYGEPRDDWLALAYDTGRRDLLVTANNHNVFGYINLSSSENPLFEVTASREGLIENEAYEQLQLLVRRCLEWGAKRVASVRGRKTHASEKGFLPRIRKPSESTQDLLDIVEENAGDSEKEKKEITEALKQKQKEDKQFEDFFERREKEHSKYEEMLRILASLGISISVFSHEVRGALTRVNASMDTLKKSLSETALNNEINESLESSEESISKLFDLSKYIVDLMDQSRAREKRPIALSAAIKGFVKHFSDYLNSRSIQFSVDIQPQHLRTEAMHPSEIDSVLFNFLTNAIKSMEKENSAKRYIAIKAYRDGDDAVLSLQDTGGGVSMDIQSRIFDAFFTTSHYSADAVAGPGSGLGLKIVQDIAHANGGTVTLAKPEKGFSCNFEFRVPLLATQRK